MSKGDKDGIGKDLEVTLNGEIGCREFQDNNVVLESTASSLSDVGDDNNDLSDMDLNEMCDKDGDIMIIDAWNLKEKHIDMYIIIFLRMILSIVSFDFTLKDDNLVGSEVLLNTQYVEYSKFVG